MVILLPEMMEQAWAHALPGREAAAQNEVMRLYLAAKRRSTVFARASQHGGSGVLRSRNSWRLIANFSSLRRNQAACSRWSTLSLC
jgi:hypothetical protein